MRRSLVEVENVDEENIVDEIQDDADSDIPEQKGFLKEDLREPLEYIPKRNMNNSIKFKPVYHDKKSEEEEQ